jgi:RNA polymerase sigma-70 factor (sigma-E family)
MPLPYNNDESRRRQGGESWTLLDGAGAVANPRGGDSGSGGGRRCMSVSFDEFVTDRLAALLRYAAVLSGDREIAQDIVQEVMIRAHRRWPQIAAMEHPERYIHRMVTNEYLSWRRRWSTRLVVLAEAPDRPTADHATDAAERDEVWLRLAGLPRRQRAVLALRYYEGLTDNEIADVLGCAPGTVRAHASRALAALRVQMVPELSPLTGESS